MTRMGSILLGVGIGVAISAIVLPILRWWERLRMRRGYIRPRHW